ncbi:unnamed protein product [Arctogadus glacialis]
MDIGEVQRSLSLKFCSTRCSSYACSEIYSHAAAFKAKHLSRSFSPFHSISFLFDLCVLSLFFTHIPTFHSLVLLFSIPSSHLDPTSSGTAAPPDPPLFAVRTTRYCSSSRPSSVGCEDHQVLQLLQTLLCLL